MPNGHSGYYDQENGVCWDEEYYDEEQSLGDRCPDPYIPNAVDRDCIKDEMIRAIAKALWDYVSGSSD